jgi:hypothetical protein
MVYGHWACKTSRGTQSSRNGGKINKTKQCGKPEASFRMVMATRGLALSKGKNLEFCDLSSRMQLGLSTRSVPLNVWRTGGI